MPQERLSTHVQLGQADPANANDNDTGARAGHARETAEPESEAREQRARRERQARGNRGPDEEPSFGQKG